MRLQTVTHADLGPGVVLQKQVRRSLNNAHVFALVIDGKEDTKSAVLDTDLPEIPLYVSVTVIVAVRRGADCVIKDREQGVLVGVEVGCDINADGHSLCYVVLKAFSGVLGV